MTRDAVRQQIRQFLEPHFEGHDLRDDEDMFLLGHVNSLFAMQLVAFVEQRFDIRMESADLEFDNFRSVDHLVALVGSKTAAVG